MGAGTDAEAPPRFPSPLIKPDMPISGIRLSDWLHPRLTSARPVVLGAQGPIHPFRRELAGALRGHLVPPSQGIPHTIVNVFIDRPIRLTRAPDAEVLRPALQLPIQLLTDVRPGCHVPAIQQFSHLLLDPAHALLRRTVFDIPAAAARTDVRSECISQKIESLLPGIPNARLLCV